VNVAFGAAFLVISGYWLDRVLDGALATRTLLYDLDPNVLVDLYYRHDSGFEMLVVIACLMAVAYLLLWCWLHGAVIFKTHKDGRMDLAHAFVRAVETTPRMAVLLLISSVALLLFTAVVAGAAWWAFSASVARPSEMLWYWIGAAAASLWVVGAVFLVAIHDHARIQVCVGGKGPAEAYWWAVRFVTRGGERAFLLAVLLNLTALLVWVVCESVNLGIRAGAGLGMTALIVWGEVFLYARMMVRVWFFGAQADLQSPA